MTTKEHEIQFLNRYGEKLRGRYTEAPNSSTCLVFLHGFPGTSEYIVAQRMDRFAACGYDVLRFDFSGSGRSEGDFAQKRISKEVFDTGAAIDFVVSRDTQKKIVLVGHSTGAIVAALYGHTDPRLHGVVLLGGVSDLVHGVRYDFIDDQVRDFVTNGFICYNRPGSWVDGKTLEKGYLDEFYTLDVCRALSNFARPCLIVHGTKDESVPWKKDPHELYVAARHPKLLIGVNGADHKFTEEEHWSQVVKHVVGFVNDLGVG
jgi:pimeloyl-ACP methyl ester carboxylesterase